MNTLNKVKISAIITSGGKSLRFGSNKLLAKLGDLSVIETTILKFINHVDEIIIPSSDEIQEFVKKSKLYSTKIKFAPPGSTRQKSVYNAILNCSNPEIVLIHDGARPFIDEEIIKKTIEMTYRYSALVVGKMAVDTIKEVMFNSNEGKIVKTLNRKTIFQAQTPQAFDYELIKKIHQKYKDNPDFTDDSSMVENEGIDVYILENNKKNIKITTKDDLY